METNVTGKGDVSSATTGLIVLGESDRYETVVSFENSIFGWAMKVSGWWSDEVTRLWASRPSKVTALRYSTDDPDANLKFLLDLDGLEHLNLWGNVSDDSVISTLENLKSLDLNTPIRRRLDFRRLGRLEYLFLATSRQGRGFQDLIELRDLRCRTNDPRTLTRMTKMERMRLEVRRVRSLQGIEGMIGLRDLWLDYSQRLVDVLPITSLTHLEEFRMDGLSEVDTLDWLAECRALKILQLGRMQSLDSLAILETLPNLTHLSVYVGALRDGALRSLIHHPTLKAIHIEAGARSTDFTDDDVAAARAAGKEIDISLYSYPA